ncbi:hypothetical protein ABPG74_016145 [Tetrahymena malaccensis]
MKIKYLLLIALCLINLCISQDQEEEIELLAPQVEVNPDDYQEVLELFEAENENGGQCFLDEIQIVSEKGNPNDYKWELSCFKSRCGVVSRIPSSQELINCRFDHCGYLGLGRGAFEFFKNEIIRTQKCLSSYEQQKINSQQNQVNSENQTIPGIEKNTSSAFILSSLLLGFNLLLF